MAHFTEFKLYWEIWGGYPDQDYPFGNPTLVWVIASKDSAVRCLVDGEPRGPMEISWSADWKDIQFSLTEPLPVLLEEAGAFSIPKQLVQGAPDGDYLEVWDLTGIFRDRPFGLSLKFTWPGEQWSPLGQRLRSALMALRFPSE